MSPPTAGSEDQHDRDIQRRQHSRDEDVGEGPTDDPVDRVQAVPEHGDPDGHRLDDDRKHQQDHAE